MLLKLLFRSNNQHRSMRNINLDNILYITLADGTNNADLYDFLQYYGFFMHKIKTKICTYIFLAGLLVNYMVFKANLHFGDIFCILYGIKRPARNV